MTKITTLAPDIRRDLALETQRNELVSKAKTLASQELKSERQVEKAAGGFEALLLHQMLKAMWKTVDSTGLFGENSHQAQVYRDMLNQAISDSVAEGRGIGVKDFLRKELQKYDTEHQKGGDVGNQKVFKNVPNDADD